MLADTANPETLDRILDEPLPSEMTDEQKKRAEMRRVADANRAAVAAITAAARTRRA